MYKRLLILCDQLPGEYEHYSIKDSNFLLMSPKEHEEIPDELFVCWDSIIPENREFIDNCVKYANFNERPAPNFVLTQKGTTDKKYGTIKRSIQEQAYLEALHNNYRYLATKAKNGEDISGELMELYAKYPNVATQTFFEKFSNILNAYDIVRILPTYSNDTNNLITRYRKMTLESWQNSDRFMDSDISSGATAISEMYYNNMVEVYRRVEDEMLKITKMTIAEEEAENNSSENKVDITSRKQGGEEL